MKKDRDRKTRIEWEMNNGPSKKPRTQRVTPLKLPPGILERGWDTVRRADVLLRISMCLIAAAILWVLTDAWYPSIPFRLGDIPHRNIVARVPFKMIDEATTKARRSEAIENFEAIYRHDRTKLRQLSKALENRLSLLQSADRLKDVESVWLEFAPQSQQDAGIAEASDEAARVLSTLTRQSQGTPAPTDIPITSSDMIRQSAEFEVFRTKLREEMDGLTDKLAACIAPINVHGLFEGVTHEVGTGNQSKIQVYLPGELDSFATYDVEKVRISEAAPKLKTNLNDKFGKNEFSDRLFVWFKDRLPTTLTFDAEMTKREARKRAEELPPHEITLTSGSVLAEGGVPIQSMELLTKEHEAYVDHLSAASLTSYAFAKFGMYIAAYALCGFYFFYRKLALLQTLAVSRILMLVVASIGISWFAAKTRFELVPLLLFSMTVVIIYTQEAALLLSACVATLFILSKGFALPELIINFSSMSSVVLLIRHVRSRTKLIFVGCSTAAITFATAVGVYLVFGDQLDMRLVQHAAWLAACCVGAGLLMTGLLPFIERFFDVQTDLSLLELGDVAHPLLQELVRRAPGTYNHSINVASIAQAAAEAIGANGLLVRVGAYFHDIGKMLKPQYFIENQSGGNRHESLVPAMSTLVIIAHVKDGADLARQHNLPRTIIDFIQQHHGTTLVEYFYHRANEQQREADPDAESIDEGNYRYPGPKPQSKETAVLMLSDAVESASRTLVDPAPSRIESLVEDIAMKRLLDGQFGECGLTLEELRILQGSITKSLTAVYHGRIKYPDQQTA